MRFIYVRIANYRGVTACEVEFAPTGITLVQGPNEVGKSSLGEAIGLLFEFPDSSTNRKVQAIKPVHRDVGSEIELQAESGPYHFTYFKRFHRKPETKLTITQPRPENLTGREAHERAETILDETVDVALWKALTILQGDAVQQPVMTNQTSLLATLDKAAGGRPADAREQGLFDRVRSEYLEYYTERGTEHDNLPSARKAQADAEAEVLRIEQAIRELDQDTDRAAALHREIREGKGGEDQLAEEVKSYTSVLGEIEALESSLTTARWKLKTAQTSEEIARTAKKERQRLIDAVAEATEAHTSAAESSAVSLSAFKKADEELKGAQSTFDSAEKRKKQANDLAALRRADHEYFRSKLDLEQLKERKSRIDGATRKAADAEEVLAHNVVDEKALERLVEAERALLVASAQLETGAPNVCLRGLADCSILLDDSEINLRKGEESTHAVPDISRFTVPGTVEIEVAAGSSTEALARRVEEAQACLSAACASADVADLDQARKAFEKRREASVYVENKTRIENENLRDLTYDQLENKLQVLHRIVPAYLREREPEPAICPDQDSAKKARTDSESVQREANEAWEAARIALDAARGIREGFHTKHLEAKVQVEMLAKSLKNAKDSLASARKEIADDILEQNLEETVRTVAEHEADVNSADASLKARNPERVKTLAETANDSLETIGKRRRAAETELTEVQTRLRIHGEEGLHERLRMAQIQCERISYESQSLFRRAAVAKLLFETMRDERDKARQAYVAPLKEKIEQLGRLVFDETIRVEISDDLQIASRTSNGVTVPFDSLSGGTKEQLSLIFRLVCSMIVAEDGGTPFILDDALGYTDPERLPLMNAVLAKAAKDCQIVILTCTPNRYANIGQATVVSLA